MDKYGELVKAENCISVHLHPLFARCNIQNNNIENSSYLKPFGIVTNIAVEFYQIAHRTCCPIQSQPAPREVPDAQGWGCPGAPRCLLWAGAMGWVLDNQFLGNPLVLE